MRAQIFLSLLWAVLLGAASSFTSHLRAQELPYDAGNSGRRYVIAFPDTAMNSYPGRSDKLVSSFYLYLYSAVTNTALISFPSGNAKSYPLNGGKFELIDLSGVGGVLTRQTGEVVRNGFIIETELPVIAYCFMATPSGMDGWTPIPVENWGKEYLAMSLPGETASNIGFSGYSIKPSAVQAPATILILAAYDGTSVTIDATGTLDGNPRRSVVMNAGEVYQVQSFVDTSSANPDLIQQGLVQTRITSSRPIGVISGNTRSLVVNNPEAISRNSLKNLLYDWIAPVEQHGTEFVYTPTWDSHKQVSGGGSDPASERGAEIAYVLNSSQGSINGTYQDAFSNGQTTFTVAERGMTAERIAGEARAAYIHTAAPSQVFMTPTPISKLIDRTVQFGFLSHLEYETYGAYMTEVIPVEQWTSFAPFVAPSSPGGLEHYVNVTARRTQTDSIFFSADGSTEQPFIFNKGLIPGTEYVWGTIPITPGVSYYLRGYGGRKFGVNVYGTSKGYENYTRIPLKYDERIGVAYGYPAAPSRNVTAPPDTLQISTNQECGSLVVEILVLSDPGVGLRSIELKKGSVNVELRGLVPASADINGAIHAQFTVAPINPEADAVATVVITDRTGNTSTIPYSYTAQRLDIPAGGIVQIPSVSVGLEPEETSFQMTNGGTADLPVSSVDLTTIGTGFEIISVTPPLPVQLKPGESVIVRVRHLPTERASLGIDTIVVRYGCEGVKSFAVTGETLEPCLVVTDKDFGTLKTGTEGAGRLTLTNNGDGTLAFFDNGSGIVEGLGGGVSIPDNELLALASARLAPGGTHDLSLSFTASDTGAIRRALRFNTNGPVCRDSAIVTARVIGVDTVITSVSLDFLETNSLGNRLAANVPNPFRESTTIEFNLGATEIARLDLFDASGGFVGTLLNESLEPGRYRLLWSATGFASGIYYLRLSAGEDWTETRRMVLVK